MTGNLSLFVIARNEVTKQSFLDVRGCSKSIIPDLFQHLKFLRQKDPEINSGWHSLYFNQKIRIHNDRWNFSLLVIARNEVTKQSFAILFENSFTSIGTDCFAPIKDRGSQWLVISHYSSLRGVKRRSNLFLMYEAVQKVSCQIHFSI